MSDMLTGVRNAEIRQLAEENRQLTHEFSDYTRGADSFAFLHIEDIGTVNARALIVHCGPNPARDTNMDIVRLSSFEDQELSWGQRARKIGKPRLGDIYPHNATALTNFDFPNWQNPEREVETYRIDIRVESGKFQQILELRHDGTLWKQAYLVRQIRPDGFTLRHWYVDPEFSGELMAQLKNVSARFSVCLDAGAD